MNKRLRVFALLLALLMGMSAAAQAAAGDKAAGWAREQAEGLLMQLNELTADENYLNMMGDVMGTAEVIRGWRGQTLAAKPVLRVYDMPDLEAVLRVRGDARLISLYRGLGDAARHHLTEGLPQLLANMVFQGEETSVMVAGTLITAGYTMPRPEDFRPLLLIYQYEDAAVMVSFTELSYGVSGQARFVPPKIIEMLDQLGA